MSANYIKKKHISSYRRKNRQHFYNVLKEYNQSNNDRKRYHLPKNNRYRRRFLKREFKMMFKKGA